jgi:hypothetical protein
MNIKRSLNKLAFAIHFPFLIAFFVVCYIVDVIIGDWIVDVKISARDKYYSHLECFKKHLDLL